MNNTSIVCQQENLLLQQQSESLTNEKRKKSRSISPIKDRIAQNSMKKTHPVRRTSDKGKLMKLINKNDTKIPDNSLCCVCVNNVPDGAFLPCGHGGLCYTCALDLVREQDECYMCREIIQRILKISINKNYKDVFVVEKSISATKFLKILELDELLQQKLDKLENSDDEMG